MIIPKTFIKSVSSDPADVSLDMVWLLVLLAIRVLLKIVPFKTLLLSESIIIAGIDLPSGIIIESSIPLDFSLNVPKRNG
jgi:hypothetical protein